MTPEEFRRHGHALIDWLADHREHLANLPVMPAVSPGEIREKFPQSPPADPAPLDGILRDVETKLVPGLTHWAHPSFFGYFPSNGEFSSVLGDFLSTGLGVLGISWQSSPALTELEEVVSDWIRQMLGLSASFSGVIQDTASTSTLVALLCARERRGDYSFNRGGLYGRGVEGQGPLIVYVSSEAHSSVEKATLLAGFGRDHLRRIAVDERYAMRVDALDEAIAADLAQGFCPAAIVATAGTTGTTAFDPIAAIAERAQKHGTWLHVDAAMAGSAMILPERRFLWEGIEHADSLVVNAHKWLGAAFDCSLYYVRDPEHLVRVMSTNPSYLQSNVDDRVKNLRDWGIPLGRRFRALKLWFLLREQGVSGLQTRLRRDLENATFFAERVRETPGWKVLAPVALQTVCVRYEPSALGLDPDALDRFTLGWAERLNRSGLAYITPAKVDGRWMVRVSIGAIMTEREHVEKLWVDMQREALATL